MANTPSFNWETPDDTDLVKDGAAAIRTLGNAIDSSMTDLKGGTTGQVLSKASNTDMDFTWVAQDDLNAIQNAIVDAKGDLISATAADTPARLAVGTDGQVLTADSTQSTGLKWSTPSSALTFTQRISGTSTTRISAIAYNGSNLYVAGGNAGTLYTSPDGITWTSRTSGFGGNNISRIAYGNGLWVAVGSNGVMTTSSDGTTWTARTANVSTNQIYDVVYDNSIWVAVASGGGTTNTGGITYSTDGITWTRKSQSLTVGTNYYSVVWNGTNWIVGASNSTNNSLNASTPSGTWTAAATGSAQDILFIAWDGTRHYYQTNTGSSAEWWYSTNSTMTSSTDLNIRAKASTGSKVYHYYSGSIYGIGSILQKMTMATGTPTQEIFGISPTSEINSSGLGDGSEAIWYGAAGWIVSDGNGRLWTSF